jgi:hypothetical protein
MARFFGDRTKTICQKHQAEFSKTSRQAVAACRSKVLSLLFVVIGNTVHDFLAGCLWAFPTENLDPFAFFQIFVMLKEVRNGF